jgi:hypothetical protein
LHRVLKAYWATIIANLGYAEPISPNWVKEGKTIEEDGTLHFLHGKEDMNLGSHALVSLWCLSYTIGEPNSFLVIRTAALTKKYCLCPSSSLQMAFSST